MMASFDNRPPYCQLQQEVIFDMSLKLKLDSLCKTVKQFLGRKTQQNKLLAEMKILCVLIAQRNRQLRREKSMQLLKRVKACLQRLSKFDISFTLASDLKADVDKCMKEADPGNKAQDVYLPNQQSWTFLLSLLHGMSELLKATMNYCISAFQHVSCHFSSGLLIPQMLLFMATLARIWQLCQVLCREIQLVYKQIYISRDIFLKAASNWEEPVLPEEILSKGSFETKAEKSEPHSDGMTNVSSIVQFPREDDTADFKLPKHIHAVTSGETQMDEDFGVVLKRKPEDMVQSPRKKKRKVTHSGTPSASMYNDQSLETRVHSVEKKPKRKKKKKLHDFTVKNEVLAPHSDNQVEQDSVTESSRDLNHKELKKRKKLKKHRAMEDDIKKTRKKDKRKMKEKKTSLSLENDVHKPVTDGSVEVKAAKKKKKKKSDCRILPPVRSRLPVQEKVKIKPKGKGSKLKGAVKRKM